MANEMNRQEAELNEAELANISGGSQPPLDATTINYASKFCSSCERKDAGCNRWKELARYISEKGYLGSHKQCPFY